MKKMTTSDRLDLLQEAKENILLGLGQLNVVLKDMEVPLMWLVYVEDDVLDKIAGEYTIPLNRLDSLIYQEEDNIKKERQIKDGK